MHTILVFVSILAVVLNKSYRKWKLFYPTMQYIAIGNLTYNFLCASHWLWRLAPDFPWCTHTMLEMGYTFVTFPFTTLMFLAFYPEEQGKWKLLKHYLFWIGLYVGIELIFAMRDRIVYGYGWTLWHSAIFDSVMFPFLRLHHKKPLVALALSVPIALILLWYFDIPVSVPIEKR